MLLQLFEPFLKFSISEIIASTLWSH